MENLVFTQLSVSEIRKMFRQEIESYFSNRPKQNESDSKPDELLTIQQAAEFLHLSPFTIYGLVSRSEIPSMKRGKRLYFSKDELLTWVKGSRRGTASDAEKEAETFLANQNKRG